MNQIAIEANFAILISKKEDKDDTISIYNPLVNDGTNFSIKLNRKSRTADFYKENVLFKKLNLLSINNEMYDNVTIDNLLSFMYRKEITLFLTTLCHEHKYCYFINSIEEEEFMYSSLKDYLKDETEELKNKLIEINTILKTLNELEIEEEELK